MYYLPFIIKFSMYKIKKTFFIKKKGKLDDENNFFNSNTIFFFFFGEDTGLFRSIFMSNGLPALYPLINVI